MRIARLGGRALVSPVAVHQVAMLGASRMLYEHQMPDARALEHEHH